MQARTHAWTLHLGRRCPHGRIPLRYPLTSSPAQMLRQSMQSVQSQQWYLSVLQGVLQMNVCVCVFPSSPQASGASALLIAASGHQPSRSTAGSAALLVAAPLPRCPAPTRGSRIVGAPRRCLLTKPPHPRGSRRSGATHRCRPTNLPALRLGGAPRRCRLTAPPYVSTCLMDALVALVWMVLWMVWVVMSAFS